MCALDEAESLEAPQVSTHYHYDSEGDHVEKDAATEKNC